MAFYLITACVQTSRVFPYTFSLVTPPRTLSGLFCSFVYPRIINKDYNRIIIIININTYAHGLIVRIDVRNFIMFLLFYAQPLCKLI